MNVTKVAIKGEIHELFNDSEVLNVPTQNIHAIITLDSYLLKTDFYKESLTLEKLWFEGLNKSQLEQGIQ